MPITTLDCILLRDRSSVFATGLGGEWLTSHPGHFTPGKEPWYSLTYFNMEWKQVIFIK